MAGPVFVAVAEQGTVSGAAQHLSISQSSVTEAIKDLESDLGVELFERHSRGLSITHKGHQVLRHATKILADVSDARRTFSHEAASAAGEISTRSIDGADGAACADWPRNGAWGALMPCGA
jgi:DNA-binding transcriptional LysR family regulator